MGFCADVCSNGCRHLVFAETSLHLYVCRSSRDSSVGKERDQIVDAGDLPAKFLTGRMVGGRGPHTERYPPSQLRSARLQTTSLMAHDSPDGQKPGMHL